MSSNEDIHISANRQLNIYAGDSVNISTQKSLLAHAQDKISLFAAQEGVRLYLGKGKVEIQAQGDGADLIARKGIQIILTEDQIEIKASKNIVLTAGGSQIEISSAGVLPTTAGKFELKAGQHQFVAGGAVNTILPNLPDNQQQKFSLWFDLREHWIDTRNSSYFVLDQKGNIVGEGEVPRNKIIKFESLESCENLSIHLYNKDEKL